MTSSSSVAISPAIDFALQVTADLCKLTLTRKMNERRDTLGTSPHLTADEIGESLERLIRDSAGDDPTCFADSATESMLSILIESLSDRSASGFVCYHFGWLDEMAELLSSFDGSNDPLNDVAQVECLIEGWISPTEMSLDNFVALSRAGTYKLFPATDAEQRRFYTLEAGLIHGNLTRWDMTPERDDDRPSSLPVESFNVGATYPVVTFEANGQQCLCYAIYPGTMVMLSFNDDSWLDDNDNLVISCGIERTDFTPKGESWSDFISIQHRVGNKRTCILDSAELVLGMFEREVLNRKTMMTPDDEQIVINWIMSFNARMTAATDAQLYELKRQWAKDLNAGRKPRVKEAEVYEIRNGVRTLVKVESSDDTLDFDASKRRFAPIASDEGVTYEMETRLEEIESELESKLALLRSAMADSLARREAMVPYVSHQIPRPWKAFNEELNGAPAKFDPRVWDKVGPHGELDSWRDNETTHSAVVSLLAQDTTTEDSE